MKPARFEYDAPTSVVDAVQLLAAHGEDARPLAGGQSLVPMLALRLARFPRLVDLNRVRELAGIELRDGRVRIGAMTRQADLGIDPLVAELAPLLVRATALVGHFQIRNRGTVGGSLAHADPAAEYPAVSLVLGAEMEIVSGAGTRMTPAAEFFQSMWTTAIGPGELLTAVHVPARTGRTGFAIEEVSRRYGDFALVGAACAVSISGEERVEQAAVAMFGVGSTPVRAHSVEAAIVGASPSASDVAEVAELVARDIDPNDDVHASARYRSHVAAYVVERALANALEEARR